jgi:hypothetical protein
MMGTTLIPLTSPRQQEHNVIKRSQYMNKESSHEEYYRQFVTPEVIKLVETTIGKDRILRSTDPYFNDIPLGKWDMLHHSVMAYVRSKLREADPCGETLSDTCCIAKQAARMIKENHHAA